MVWRCVGTDLTESRFVIDGVNVWAHEWEATGETVEVKDPQYKKTFEFRVYELNNGTKVISFAAGEFSSNAWGFFVDE